MNLRSIATQLKANMLAGNATLIKGAPGLGKTDLMSHAASWWRKQNPGKSVGFSCFFMATQTPIGFTGLPWRGELEYNGKKYTTTSPAIPQWFMAVDLETGQVRPGDTFDSVFLVIEEWGQGSPETKRAGAEVLRAGGTPPYYLPPGSPRVALSNVDARDGVTKEFDFIIGRRGELEVTGDCDVWIEDFADRPYSWQGKTWSVTPTIKTWARQNPTILFEDRPKKQGPWCNPRSLTSADRYVQTITALSGGTTPVNDGDFFLALAGHIGTPAAQSLVSTMQFALELPQLEQVVADPLGTPVPAKADLQMLMAYELAGRCKPDQLGQVIQYMSKEGKPRMPKDMVITFISSLFRRDWKNFASHPAMQAWTAKNSYLISTIAALSKI